MFLTPSLAYHTWISNVSINVDELKPQSGTTLASCLVSCFYKLVDIFTILLHAETNPNGINLARQTSSHIASNNRCVNIVRLLLERWGVEVKLLDRDGSNALSLAARCGHERIVEMLLSKGAEVNTEEKGIGHPLSCAVASGNERVVEMLLEKGAEVNGIVQLCMTAGCGYEKIVEILLEKGADLKTTDRGGGAPVAIAARYGYEKIMEMLLSKGADVNAGDGPRDPPLYLAACRG